MKLSLTQPTIFLTFTLSILLPLPPVAGGPSKQWYLAANQDQPTTYVRNSRSHQHHYLFCRQRILKMQLKIKSNYFPQKDYLSKISISKLLYSLQRYNRQIQLTSCYKLF